MRSEMDTRLLISKHKEFLESIVDPVCRKCEEAFIDGMEMILDE